MVRHYQPAATQLSSLPRTTESPRTAARGDSIDTFNQLMPTASLAMAATRVCAAETIRWRSLCASS